MLEPKQDLEDLASVLIVLIKEGAPWGLKAGTNTDFSQLRFRTILQVLRKAFDHVCFLCRTIPNVLFGPVAVNTCSVLISPSSVLHQSLISPSSVLHQSLISPSSVQWQSTPVRRSPRSHFQSLLYFVARAWSLARRMHGLRGCNKSINNEYVVNIF